MPKARTRFERGEQFVRWAENNWPCGRPIDVKWVDGIYDDDGVEDKDCYGQTYRLGGRIIIEIKKIKCRECIMSTLRHEFAHAYLWGHYKAENYVEHHPGHLGTLIWEIELLWNEIGWEEANEYGF